MVAYIYIYSAAPYETAHSLTPLLSISLCALSLLHLALGLLHWSLVAGELSVLVFLPASCSLRVGFLVVLLEVKVDVDGVLLVPG